MSYKMITGIIMLSVSISLILWDIWVAITPEKGDTISELIRSFARNHPMIPFALGVLVGHWFWTSLR